MNGTCRDKRGATQDTPYSYAKFQPL